MKLLKDLLGITRRQRLHRLELQVKQLAEDAMYAAELNKCQASLMQESGRNQRNAHLHLKRETIRNNELIQEVARERGVGSATLTELSEKASIHASQKMLIMDSKLEELVQQHKDDAKKSQDEEES